MTIELIEVKVSELSGAALRYSVGLAVGFSAKRLEEGDYKPGEPHWWMIYSERLVTPTRNGLIGYVQPSGPSGIYAYKPDVDWAQGGPLVSHFNIGITVERKGLLYASVCDDRGMPVMPGDVNGAFGPTHLIAACRAIVASVLGDTVSVPKELCHE